MFQKPYGIPADFTDYASFNEIKLVTPVSGKNTAASCLFRHSRGDGRPELYPLDFKMLLGDK
ncbi:hypothetical protein GZ78_00540 [Endozoicomonas numazuensis]|uniref:Uncharacterized protein n=1 Tax=Endozoicomonas numazuensis TaxID=1137799 RepID=A0A081NJN1_9GAMM|nr:hypothetical protein GZ78_00540 [Endozoicomonas numazuensis]